MSWHSTPLVGVEDVGQLRRQVGEGDRRRDQRVERRVGQQSRARRPAGGDSPSAARCEGATLPTWLEMSLQPAASGRRRRAAPAHRRRRTRTAPAPSPRRRRAAARSRARRPTRWYGPRGRSRPARRRAPRSAAPSACAMPARAGSMSTTVTSVPGIRGAQPRHQQPEHAGADHRDPVRRSGRAVPQRR